MSTGVFSTGEVLALGSALIWAFAVILFRISGRSVSPLGLNFFKTVLATTLLFVTLIALRLPLFPDYPLNDYMRILLSGIVGIGISDTLLFASLNRLGAGLNAIINCSYSPSVLLLAAIFLNERMTPLQLAGILLIITAVVIISRGKLTEPLPKKTLTAGIILGIGAMLSMAVSIIFMKSLLNSTSMLWATMIRTMGGLGFSGFALLAVRKRHEIFKQLLSVKNWTAMIPGSIFGSYLALIAWMGGMTYAKASVAAVLNQTNSVFIFILGIVFLKEKASPAKLLALFIALVGVLLVTL